MKVWWGHVFKVHSTKMVGIDRFDIEKSEFWRKKKLASYLHSPIMVTALLFIIAVGLSDRFFFSAFSFVKMVEDLSMMVLPWGCHHVQLLSDRNIWCTGKNGYLFRAHTYVKPAVNLIELLGNRVVNGINLVQSYHWPDSRVPVRLAKEVKKNSISMQSKMSALAT